MSGGTVYRLHFFRFSCYSRQRLDCHSGYQEQLPGAAAKSSCKEQLPRLPRAVAKNDCQEQLPRAVAKSSHQRSKCQEHMGRIARSSCPKQFARPVVRSSCYTQFPTAVAKINCKEPLRRTVAFWKAGPHSQRDVRPQRGRSTNRTGKEFKEP